MSNVLRKIFVPVAFLAAMMFTGCTSYDEYPGREVVVDRGYYYYPDYYDTYGHYHGRDYWYYDGHSYGHRDALPHGEVAHLRADVGHGGSFGHDAGHAGGEAHGGGDGGHGR